jgi:glyoxylase-like metal-dependent hydrolase (beta-lactamase superfamily II)
MSKRPDRHVLKALLIWPLVTPSLAIGQATTEYEVYAIEYGSIPDMPLSGLLPRADSSLMVDASFMVWVIKGPDGRNILVDTGYRPDVSNTYTQLVQGYLRPDQAVAKLGIAPEDISDIILTHLHWDHADGLPLFPNAHVWVQKAELEYYATEAWQEGGNAAGVEPRNVPELVKLNTEGRVTLVEGDDQEIFEGIRVYTGPKHTFASQYAGVNTSGGTVIIASDCLWFYANLELKLAKAYTFDPEADFEAFDRMKRLASNPDWILPGHDRTVFEKFPNPVEGVARIR